MQIGIIGLNHHSASIAEREKIALTDAQKIELMRTIIELGTVETVVLGTCGRFEIYYVTQMDQFEPMEQKILKHLRNNFKMTANFYQKSGFHVIEHLFKVSSGLDSAVLGEDQILGQTKNALTLSSDCLCSGKILNKLFREAVSFSKRIKTELKISETPLSLSYIGIKKAKSAMTFTEDTIITMVGLGKMGGLAIKYLFESPFKTIYIAVRNPEKLPQEILDHDKIMIVPFDDRYDAINKSHLIISSTAAPHPVIRKSFLNFKTVNPVIVDLALPRDCEQSVYEMPEITAWDVDALKEVSDENYHKRQTLVKQVDNLIFDKSNECLKWIEATKVDDLLKSWNNSIDEIKEQTIEILSRKMDLSDGDLKLFLDKHLESALKKMIKKPLESLKTMDNSVKREHSVQLLKELYGYD
ncbi:glutamyl-tRNA reductase [Fusibacter sp. 3D3]|uniref:glutamyl-tRNA reductase n=1 Tax=Fusibacter sp. 3D3 TaxID=1048380 RepID=UPI00085314EE|nr:glutamyl-tRNA reductase [Fusibacter sp. 3D3]GAU76889.1 glutamyl-tRNA reductase [Fusibacter sp. 3D3]